MTKKRVHLICNAHIDPVWLWEWEEGAGVALSTFRTAADLCGEFDGFVFNHNEAILYEWIEEYEPTLFKRIQQLVKNGKWHIMGGWYLQPDCNMPSGESFVRQALLGRSYFQGRFGVEPRVAVNLDPFGHSRGLVQILAKSGYEAYLYCRPVLADSGLPADEVLWEGFDGSRIYAVLGLAHYNSSLGEARSRVEAWLKDQAHRRNSALLWGVGNHGGGASREDLRELSKLMKRADQIEICHSTPEAYLKDLKKRRNKMPVHCGGINPWAVGCYTSMARVKQRHRALESALYMTEKMAAAGAFQAGMPYPHGALLEAEKDLATCQFHDILPGSGIPQVEEAALRRLDHGLQIASLIRARAFFALTSGQKKAGINEIPVCVYNPHPFCFETTIECEMEREEPNWNDTFMNPEIRKGKTRLPSQVEQESSNISQDFRKRVIFRATLAPSSMNRFSCRMQEIPTKPALELSRKKGQTGKHGKEPPLLFKKGQIVFQTRNLEVWINTRTGWIDRYQVGGVDCLKKNAFAHLIMKDDPDSWGTLVKRFRTQDSRFRLMSQSRSARFAGSSQRRLPSVRVIEDGPVRSVIEAVFAIHDSCICQQYLLPKQGTELEVRVRVFWNEKQRMLKLSIPTRLESAEYWGQVAFGRERLDNGGNETVAQQWTAAVSEERNHAITCINKTSYGSDMKDGEIRFSLLRSPAYASLPVANQPLIAQDRFIPHMDQGERLFRFWLNAGPKTERLDSIETEARVKHEKPFALPYFPSGEGHPLKPVMQITDSAVQVTALKKAEKSNHLIIRLFEPTGRPRSFTLTLPFIGLRTKVSLGAFEIKTLRIDTKKGKSMEVDLMENRIGGRRQ